MSAALSPLHSALAGRCPRCSKGSLFAGLLDVADRCPECDLDFAAQDAGDGPIALVVLVLGALVVGLAFVTEILFAPPFWVHLLLWIPVIVGGSILLLRPFKAWLIGQHYRHRAPGSHPAA
jgi:uncharacterized protein (DUF983 family)